MSTTAPALRHDLRLTADELADQNLRHRNMRSRYHELGFATVAEAQAYSDCVADHLAGLPVSPAFAAGLAAAEKARAEQATRDAAAAASWSAQQRLTAATERRDNAQRRVAVARGTLAYLPQLRSEICAFDFGRPADAGELLGFGQRLSALAAVEAHLTGTVIPQLQADAAAAQRDLDTLVKAPTATASPTKAGRN